MGGYGATIAKILGGAATPKMVGLGFLGLAGTEALKYGIIHPALKAGRIIPSQQQQPARVSGAQEQFMYGNQGFLGIGAQQGFLDRQLRASLESQQISAEADVRRQKAIATAQTIIGEAQARRDMYSAKQNTISNAMANMANIVAAAPGLNMPTAYGQTTAGLSNMVAPVSQVQRINPRRRRNTNYGSMYGGAYGGMM